MSPAETDAWASYYHQKDEPKPVPFSVLSSLIRMGHKYTIPKVMEDALYRLKKYYPTSLSAWDDVATRARHVTALPMHAFEAVRVARLTETPSILPSAFFTCCKNLRSTFAEGDSLERHRFLEKLSVDDAWRLINGRENLARGILSRLTSILIAYSSLPSEYRTAHKACQGRLIASVQALRTDDPKVLLKHARYHAAFEPLSDWCCIEPGDPDTANCYSNGVSETILGKAIKELGLPREELVVMTKVYFATPDDPAESLFRKGLTPADVGIINQHGLNRKHIFDSVKASLKRLQLDYVDVVQCHRFDYETPIEETMRALDDLVKAGYVRYIGMSSCHAYQFHQMQTYALAHNLTPFISMQNHNLAYREEEREMFPTLAHFGVGAIPWSPLARGLLTRPATAAAQTTRGQGDWYMPYKDQSTTDVIAKVEEVAKRKGVSMAQVAVAWILSKPGVTVPIVGTTSLANLKDILGGLDVQLTEDEIKELEAPYRPQPIMGHD